MNCKVSILIPVFNRDQFIGECIQSALDQTYDDFEVIVFDNASEDHTYEICKKFAEQDCRVKVFQNETNIGPVGNWLACAEHASGEYSKILFSDDLLEPDCIDKMLSVWDRQDIGFVFCAAIIGKLKEHGKLAYSLKGTALIDAKKFFRLILSGKASRSPGSIMLRTADLKNNLISDFPTSKQHDFAKNGAGPDLMIMLLTATEYKYVKYFDEPLVFFRRHSDSFTFSDPTGAVRDNYEYMICYYLHRYESWMNWIAYVSSRFVRVIFLERKLHSPQLFIKDREGEGSLYEVVILILFLPIVIFERLVRKSTTMFIHLIRR